MRRAISHSDALRFFAPLIFMTELNMISKSVIHAFLARLAAPKVVLAAFSISFTSYYTVTSSTEVCHLLSLSYLRDRRSIRRLAGFFCVLVGPPLVLAQAVAWTSFGDTIYGVLFGAGPVAVAQARWATALFSLSAPILLLRALAFSLIMLNRRTVLITLSTLLRLLSLSLFLAVYPAWLEGAAVGAAALVSCMAVESAFATWAARGYFRALPADVGEPPSYGEMWRFSWPLMLSQVSEIGIVMGINVFLGRLARPELALAAFGVVHGLVSVLLSPLRNLVQTAQTLVRSREDMRVLVRFTGALVAGFTVLVAGVFLTPFFRQGILTGVMGLTPELAAYSTPGVMIAFAVALCWGYAALFRGLLAGARRTTTIAASGLARIVIVIAAGVIPWRWPGINGAVFGIAAWAVTFAAETLILGLRIRAGDREGASLYPEEG